MECRVSRSLDGHGIVCVSPLAWGVGGHRELIPRTYREIILRLKAQSSRSARARELERKAKLVRELILLTSSELLLALEGREY